MIKVKNVVVAHAAQLNQHIAGAVDIFGSFDNMIQPIFPFPLERMSIILTFENITKPTTFEVRLNGPDDELISRGEFQPMVDPLGIGKKIIDIEHFLIKNRGKYTMDIFEKTGEELKFLKTEILFIAEFPPPRVLTDEQREEISKNADLIKTVKTEFKPFGIEQTLKIQHNILSDMPIEEGYQVIPEDEQIEVEGQKIILTGLKRHIEWMFGNPIPKEQPEKEQPTGPKEVKEEE